MCSHPRGAICFNKSSLKLELSDFNCSIAFCKLVNHINSTARDSLNSCTPYQLSRLLLDNSLHTEISLQAIQPDDAMLKPALLKH